MRFEPPTLRFGLTQSLKIASCRPYCFNISSNSYLHAGKRRTYYLVGLLSERAHRAFRLWGPSVFHHLFVPEKPQSAAGAFVPLRETAESDCAVADFQRSVRGGAIEIGRASCRGRV